MGSDGDVPGRHPGQAGKTYNSDWKDPYATESTDKKITPVNALKGLFQPQPQYPTPGTTQMYPEATPKHLGNDTDTPGRSPGKSSSTFASDWKDPYATEEKPSKDDQNYLKGLFQPKPQYPSPNKTLMPPEAVQKNLGDDSNQPGKPGKLGNPYAIPEPATADAGLPINSLPGAKKEEEKKEEEKKD